VFFSDHNTPSERHLGEQTVLHRTLTIWENGFTIDDGPLMSFEDPQNARLLQAVMQGQAARELLDPNDPDRHVRAYSNFSLL
jgi:UBX domain-containing protein 1